MQLTARLNQDVNDGKRLPRITQSGRCPTYKLSISFRRSSFVLPSFCSSRPNSSSSFPSENARSLSVNCAYFCFSLPFTSFQLPLNPNFVIIIHISLAERRSVASPLVIPGDGYRSADTLKLPFWQRREAALFDHARVLYRCTGGKRRRAAAKKEVYRSPP